MDGIGFFCEKTVEIRRKSHTSIENPSKQFHFRRNSAEFIAKTSNYSGHRQKTDRFIWT